MGSLDKSPGIPAQKYKRPTSGAYRPAVSDYKQTKKKTRPTIRLDESVIGENYMISENEKVYNPNKTNFGIITPKYDYSYEAISNIITPFGKNIFQLAGLPRHVLLLAFLPFFPIMLLFTASGGAAFFVTTGVEWVLSFLLPEVRQVTFGTIWISLTFLFFSPVIYFTIRLFVD